MRRPCIWATNHGMLRWCEPTADVQPLLTELALVGAKLPCHLASPEALRVVAQEDALGVVLLGAHQNPTVRTSAGSARIAIVVAVIGVPALIQCHRLSDHRATSHIRTICRAPIADAVDCRSDVQRARKGDSARDHAPESAAIALRRVTARHVGVVLHPP